MSVFRCSIRFIDQKLWFDGCRIQSDYYTQYLHEEQVDLLRPICDTLSQLGQYIDLQSDRITLPTYHHRSSRPWQAFIAGGWFEYLVAQWLRDGSEPIEVETNLQLHDRPKNSRDADLIIRYKHQLMVIELKADWHNFNAASDQLESLKNIVNSFRTDVLQEPKSRLIRVHAALPSYYTWMMMLIEMDAFIGKATRHFLSGIQEEIRKYIDSAG